MALQIFGGGGGSSAGGGGASAGTPRTLTSATTLAAGDQVVANAAAGAFTLTLPASPTSGNTIEVKKYDATNLGVTISGGTIDGAPSLTLSSPTAAVKLRYQGGQWQVVAAVGTYTGGIGQAFPPTKPAITTLSPESTAAVVGFSAPVSDGGSPVTGYTVTASPGGATGTGTTSPIKVSGLTNDTSYTFTVHATNAVGSGPESSASAAVKPFNPTSLTGLAAWYDAAQITASEASAVSAFSDLSGNARHLAQATGTKQPIYFKTNGVVTLPNGRPVLQFNGGQALVLANFAAALSQPNTIFLAGSSTSASGVHFLFDGSTARETIHFDAGNTLRLYAGSLVNTTTSEPLPFSVINATYNGASSLMRVNGTQVGAGNPGSTALNGITLGADNTGGLSYLTGFIGEVIVFNRTLTAGEVTQVETYLRTKWGTA